MVSVPVSPEPAAPPDEWTLEQIQNVARNLRRYGYELTPFGEVVAGAPGVTVAFEPRVVDTPPPTDTRIETGTHIDGRLIEDLADLPTGWDGYEAERLTEEALDVLRCVIVTPTTQGGFQIEWHTIDEDFEVEVGANGRVINDEDEAGVHRG